MLLQVGREAEIRSVKMLLGEKSEDIKFYYQTQNREFFKIIDSDRKYPYALSPFPNRSFAFIFLRPVDFLNKQYLSKARVQATKGIIFNSNTFPEDIENFLTRFSEIKRANKLYDEIKEINDGIEAKYKERKKDIKERNKSFRDNNKALEKEWKTKNKVLEKEWKSAKKELKVKFEESMNKLSEEQKEFMPKEPPYEPEPDYFAEPKYTTLLTEPPEPRLRDLPRSQHIHLGDNNLQKRFPVAWQILSTFDSYKIEGTSFSILKRKKESLSYTYENLSELTIDSSMTRDEFLDFFYKNEKNEKVLENFRPSLAVFPEALDLLSENIDLMNDEEWTWSEEDEEYNDEMMPALATIKPMHAASLLSAGMKFSKEVRTDKGLLLIKSAPVKVYLEQEQIINGKRITTIIQTHDSKLALYDIDRRKLDMYSGIE